MARLVFFIAFLTLLSFTSWGQENFPVNGVKDKRPKRHAFTNATVYVDYQTKIENATLIVDDGKVIAIGANEKVPAGVQIHNMKGKVIYPAFIDLFSHYGQPEVKEEKISYRSKPQLEPARDGVYGWNDAINADYNAIEEFKNDKSSAEAYRKQGFGTVLTFRPDGIARGTAALVSLSDEPEHHAVLVEKAARHFSFKRGSSEQSYPASLMGVAALLRQTYYDAQWYSSSLNKEQTNLSLEAISDTKNLPALFEAEDKYEVLLADKIGKEFGIRYVIKGVGDEYQRVEEIKASGNPLIIPLKFPQAYDAEDPYKTLELSLAKMKHWELAASNAKILSENGVDYALTASDTLDVFLTNLRTIVKRGLKKSDALKSLTYNAAQFINAYDKIGSLEEGKVASFFITNGDIFDDNTLILESWISGKKYNTLGDKGILETGEYELVVGDREYLLRIEEKEKGEGYSSKVLTTDTSKFVLKSTIKAEREEVSLTFYEDDATKLLFGWIRGDSLFGKTNPGENAAENWYAQKTGDIVKKEENQDSVLVEQVIYPFTAFGWLEKPQQESYLIKNATVWTNESEGILESTDVLVSGGKIQAVGKNLQNGSANVIDGTGKHLTSGIIDEHSHIALFDVNEGSQAVTSEVRMEDVINPEDINIYRQLAGGVTASQLLHGSANPIGGQSAIVKLKWGLSPREMLIPGADPFIKFALGENVKQSNWGDAHVIRFPQTRMGVEQVYEDAFSRARLYKEEWERYNSLSAKSKAATPKPRRDLELEALMQILNDERFITCHSYVQSEINMLINVAERYDFNVNTFTHILEGYKVADKMKEHGAAGSTFSDWWAYKYEVREAIPYNAALMNEVGVVTSINSDDAEMGRRLNQEAGKTVRYGDVPEEEAWKMVTLNPAKMLHLDDRMGSIKVGKDADLVLWTTHPLSVYAKPDFTMIEGVLYFEKEKDVKMREWVAAERDRLVQLMLSEKHKGEATQEIEPEKKKILHCDD